ncbi:MAG: YceI family protein [Zoogloeaceae bacterium]|nr:YceI family protein [Zoogloeaceae bacterium]
MKTLNALLLSAALGAVPLFAATPAAAHSADPGQYKIDPVHSYAFFTLTHLGVSRFTGRFDKLTGEVTADGTGAGNKVAAEIDISSVDTGFVDRDKHLKSPDFFAAAQYPKAKFESSKVVIDAKGEGTLTGNLTLHGVTKPVTFKLQHIGAGKDPWGGYRSGYVATTTLKRSEFGMTFMLDGLGDAVDLVLNIETIKQ